MPEPSCAALYTHAIKTISQLRAENKRLQAEVARLETDVTKLSIKVEWLDTLLHRGLGKGM